jgi:hypothetical protein
MSEPSNKVYTESIDNNSRITKYCARHLKRKFCEAYCFASRTFFRRSSNEVADADDIIYTWPKERVHLMARETHAALNLRFPVPDDKVPWDELEPSKYEPRFAVEEDAYNYPVPTSKNLCGRFSSVSFLHIFLFLSTFQCTSFQDWAEGEGSTE